MARTEDIQVPLRDGATMGAHVAYPDKTPAGAIIAIMEIWGVNDTMREHAQEFAEAGWITLVPDLFWRLEPGVELSDGNRDHWAKAIDLYYDFDYELGVQDMEDTASYLRSIEGGNGKVGTVGYCLGGKMGYLMCCRSDIDCAVAYYGTQIHEYLDEGKNVSCPIIFHMGEHDDTFSVEDRNKIHGALIGKENVSIHMYDAGHAFCNSDRPDAHNLEAAEAAHERSFKLFDTLQ